MAKNLFLALLFSFASILVPESGFSQEENDPTTLGVATASNVDSSSVVSPVRFLPPYNRFFYVGFGFSGYRGDLSAAYRRFQPSIHAGLQLNRAKRVNSRFEAFFTQVAGDDPNFRATNEDGLPANQEFSSRMLGLTYYLHINALKTERIQVYAAPGLGLFGFQPRNVQSENLSTIEDTRAEGESFSEVSLMTPLLVGGNWNLGNGMFLGVEASLLFPQTDYLDNISELSDRSVRDNVLNVKMRILVPFNSKNERDAWRNNPKSFDPEKEESEKQEEEQRKLDRQKRREEKKKEKEERKSMSDEEKQKLKEEKRKEREMRIEELKKQREQQ